MIEFPVTSRSETTAAEFDVLLAYDTDGTVLPLSEESVGVELHNISEPPAGSFASVLYRIDAGEWTELAPGNLVNLDLDSPPQTLSVKRAYLSGDGRVRVTIVGVPAGLYAEETELSTGGPAGPAGTHWAVTVNPQTGTAYTLQASDNGVVVTLANAAAITLTVPSGLGANFACEVIQIGAGQVTVVGSGITLNAYGAKVKFAGQHAAATLVAYVADVFNLAGNLTT